MEIWPFEGESKFISIRAFPHFAPYLTAPKVVYFRLSDFDEMKLLDGIIS